MTDKQMQDHCDKGLHNETNIVMEVRPIPFSIAGYYVTIKCNRCGKVFIKERLTNYTEYTDRTNKTIDNLKAENDELKIENKRFEEVASYWHKRIFKVERSERKLKQTLTEIKEIAENAYCLTNGTNKDMANFANKILQKISEVENG